MSGYWQSEKYFKAYEQLIREQFRFKPELSGRNVEIADTIAHCNAVSIHVRRGDYVSNPNTNAVHGTCGIDYYQKAIQHIEQHVSESVFFIFSDEVDWVKANLQIKGEHYFCDFNKGQESYNDMRLMSLCKHHIIANSSFSWWGAWLNPNRDKIVIAPKQWFRYPTRTLVDRVPDSWVRL